MSQMMSADQDMMSSTMDTKLGGSPIGVSHGSQNVLHTCDILLLVCQSVYPTCKQQGQEFILVISCSAGCWVDSPRPTLGARAPAWWLGLFLVPKCPNGR